MLMVVAINEVLSDVVGFAGCIYIRYQSNTGIGCDNHRQQQHTASSVFPEACELGHG